MQQIKFCPISVCNNVHTAQFGGKMLVHYYQRFSFRMLTVKASFSKILRIRITTMFIEKPRLNQVYQQYGPLHMAPFELFNP